MLRKTAPADVKTVILYSRIAHPSVDVCEAIVEPWLTSLPRCLCYATGTWI
jgi:hypothetical protein